MRDVLREIVNQRLKQEPALTWRNIVSALRSPLVQEEELARTIECQYIPFTHEHKRSDTHDSTNAQLVIPRASPASSQVSGVASQTNQHPGYYEGLPPPNITSTFHTSTSLSEPLIKHLCLSTAPSTSVCCAACVSTIHWAEIC